jgi:hypothetical protein
METKDEVKHAYDMTLWQLMPQSDSPDSLKGGGADITGCREDMSTIDAIMSTW